MSVQILIPAYQPDNKLTELVESLRMVFPVTVVDDGSGEAYASIFSQLTALGANVLRHKVNRGKGAALKTGISFIMGQAGIDGIVTADADGQHTMEDILKIAQALTAYPDTLILGRRDFSQMPARSRFGNTVSHFFFRLCTGINILDTQTGLRGLPACLFERLTALPGSRYEYEMNMLLALKQWHVPYMEVPISTVYFAGNPSTHFHAVKDGLHVFSSVIRYAASSLFCAAVDYLLYLLFLSALPIGWSYAAARVCRASLNYVCNCKLVFSGKPTLANFAGYFGLALCSLMVGSVAASLLANLGVHRIAAKLLVDCCLFIANYLLQKKLVFRQVSTNHA